MTNSILAYPDLASKDPRNWSPLWEQYSRLRTAPTNPYISREYAVNWRAVHNKLKKFLVYFTVQGAGKWAHRDLSSRSFYQKVKAPLYMLIPPSSISVNDTKKVTRTMTRSSWVEEHWRDELGDITAEGSTPAFISKDTGLTTFYRMNSPGYYKFKQLIEFYRNNGMFYDPRDASVLAQGNIYFFVDNIRYNGYFTSFDYEETEEMPFRITYSFNFRVVNRRVLV